MEGLPRELIVVVRVPKPPVVLNAYALFLARHVLASVDLLLKRQLDDFFADHNLSVVGGMRRQPRKDEWLRRLLRDLRRISFRPDEKLSRWEFLSDYLEIELLARARPAAPETVQSMLAV